MGRRTFKSALLFLIPLVLSLALCSREPQKDSAKQRPVKNVFHRKDKIPSYNLFEAIEGKIVQVVAKGSGLTAVQLAISHLGKKTIRVKIPAGIIFTSVDRRIQDMVVCRSTTISLEVGSKEVVRLKAACINMRKSVPTNKNHFSGEVHQVRGKLKKLIKYKGFSDYSSRVQQFAVWTLTDNPERHGYMGIGRYGIGSGPSDKEMIEVKELLRSASLPVNSYKAFSPRSSRSLPPSSGFRYPKRIRPPGNENQQSPKKQLYMWVDENGVRHFSDKQPMKKGGGRQ